jgi:hypothetical protein
MPILKINNFFLVILKNILYICLRNLKKEIMKTPSQKKIDIIYYGSIAFCVVIIVTTIILNLYNLLK